MKKRTPTGKVVIQLRREKPKVPKCAICKKSLHGIPRLIPSELRKLPKSKKRPSRVYGGYLCSACVKELLREKVRKL